MPYPTDSSSNPTGELWTEALRSDLQDAVEGNELSRTCRDEDVVAVAPAQPRRKPYALRVSRVRRAGDNIWRPSVGLRLSWLLMGAAFLAGTAWLASEGGLSLRDKIAFSAADVAAVTVLPIVFFRWRMVLDNDHLCLVFVRARRLAVREIVEAKSVPGDGLTFVLSDGRTESFAAVANNAWGHRRRTPTRADLAARAVLCAAARARGDVPPMNYRLPPMRGLKKAAIEGGIWAAIVGLFVGN